MADPGLELIARLRDELSPQLHRMIQLLDQAGKNRGTRDLTSHFRGLRDITGGLSNEIKSAFNPALMGLGITSAGVAASLYAVISTMQRLSKASTALHHLSAETQISTSDIQRLIAAGGTFGVSAEDMSQTLGHF